MKQLLILILFISTGLQLKSQATDGPNIILIIADDLNDYIEPLGAHPDVETPNINRIANNGTTFLNAYCSSPLCAPSRTSFLTGKDAFYTKVYGNNGNFGYKCNQFSQNFTAADNNAEYFTIPEYLKDSGNYFTYSINKVFHCHYNYPEYDTVTANACDKLQAWNKYTHFSDTAILKPIQDAIDEGVGAYAFGRLNDTLEPYMMDYIATDSAIDFIQQYNADPSAFCNKPFFMALGYHEPHKDQFVPEKYFSSFYVPDFYEEPFNYAYNFPAYSYPQNGLIPIPQPDTPWADLYALPENGVARSMVKTVDSSFMNWANNLDILPEIDPGLNDSLRREILTWSKRANAAMAYLAAVKYIDAQVGRLLDELESHPEILNNTVLIFIGDHGHALGEKKHWGKNALWETDIRTSMVIADFRNPESNVTNRVVNLLDLFPTICDFAGLTYPEFSDGSNYLDGESIQFLLQNPNQFFERPSLSTVIKASDDEAGCFPQYSVRDEKFHYIKYKSNGGGPGICDSANSFIEEELYEIGVNREVDPNEWNNLIDNDDYQPVINYLQQWLPDSALYLSKTFKAIIQNQPVDCILSHEDTLFLHAEIYDTSGVMVLMPAGYQFRWTNNFTGDQFVGVDAIVPLQIISDDLFDESSSMMIYGEMIDTVNDVVAAFDTKYFYLNDESGPSVSFNAVQTGTQTVSITELVINGTYNAIWWDFGEGIISYTDDPGPYTYTNPGEYIITCYIQFGNNPDCIITSEQVISAIENNYIDDDALKVFPNPATNFVNVVSTQGNLFGGFRIYNLLGEQVKFIENYNLDSIVLRIDISELKSGLYFIQHNHHATPFAVF